MTQCDVCKSQTMPGVSHVTISRRGTLNLVLFFKQTNDAGTSYDDILNEDICGNCVLLWLKEQLDRGVEP